MNRSDPWAALPQNLVPVKAVASRMGVSKMTVYRLIHAGDLRAYKVGATFRVDPRDVVALVRSGNTIAFEVNGGGQA